MQRNDTVYEQASLRLSGVYETLFPLPFHLHLLYYICRNLSNTVSHTDQLGNQLIFPRHVEIKQGI